MENTFTVANPSMSKIYEHLNEPRKGQFGVYKKCVFHLHTPASHDYYFLSEFKDDSSKFEKMEAEDIFEMVTQRQIIPANKVSLDELTFEQDVYKDMKEYLAYILIADSLFNINAEMVVVADHNTLDGYKKLSYAIEKYWKYKRKNKYPEIICGIEISCADKLHVIGIFDFNDKIGKEIEEWIDEYVLSNIDGTYLPSVEVLEFIFKLNGIGYIAHIDTSDIFKKEKFLSGAYRKKLFSLPNLNVIGVSDILKIDSIKERIKPLSEREFNFVVDEDAHCLEEIGTKYFWIKGVASDFNTIKKAIRDYNISIELSEPMEPNIFIKGMYLVGRDEAFLKGKDGKGDFEIIFSNSLNCFIGGRGTGKSTALQMLDFTLGQNYMSEADLQLLCNNKEIWILYYKDGVDYLVLFNVPTGQYDNVYSAVEKLSEDLRKSGGWDSHEERVYIQNKYIQIFRMRKKGGLVERKEIKNVSALLASFFDTTYSVNELVQYAETSEISDYIKNTVQKNKKISQIKALSNARSFKGLREQYKNLLSILQERSIEIDSIIKEYNEVHKKDIKIVHKFAFCDNHILDFEDIFGIKWRSSDRWFNRYNIKTSRVAAYFEYVHSKIGTIKMYEYIVEKKLFDLENVFSVRDFATPLNVKMVDEGIKELSKENLKEFFEEISLIFYSKDGISKLIYGLNYYLKSCERFNLEFNINNKEDIKNARPIFKSLSQLSLGQKVVAMLSFVLSYSDYSNDYRPLVIDQPEDNLDNQYIYKNLVKQLREVKTKRQVIIATHNATIVTNAKAEQVIVMESDNEHGWIKATGYPNDIRIVKHIVNNLEGGVDSFKHKCFVYSDIMGD